MAKKTSSNAVKKIDKQLDKLLKEKREIEDIPVVDQKEVLHKIKEEDKRKKTSNKKEAIVVKDRKTKTKKDAIVVKERATSSNKSNTTKKQQSKTTTKKTNEQNKKSSTKRSITMSSKTKKDIQKNSKEKAKKTVSESTLKMQKLETEMRSLYDKVSDIVEDTNYEKEQEIKLPVVVEKEPEKEEVKEGWNILSIIAFILSIIFTILFIVFVIFIIYVCTY